MRRMWIKHWLKRHPEREKRNNFNKPAVKSNDILSIFSTILEKARKNVIMMLRCEKKVEMNVKNVDRIKTSRRLVTNEREYR